MIVFDIFQLDSILTLTGCSEVNEVFNQCSSLPILEGCWLYFIMVIFEYCRISAWQCIYTVVLAYVSIWQSEACSLQLYSPVQPCSGRVFTLQYQLMLQIGSLKLVVCSCIPLYSLVVWQCSVSTPFLLDENRLFPQQMRDKKAWLLLTNRSMSLVCSSIYLLNKLLSWQ